jgi:hypothetical protein
MKRWAGGKMKNERKAKEKYQERVHRRDEADWDEEGEGVATIGIEVEVLILCVMADICKENARDDEGGKIMQCHNNSQRRSSMDCQSEE